ncbi:alpha-xylosidase [Amnibacterium flavum]|uniref:alpha-D-xyloside xylohydrolase n=1 Tax=Amnibacterium flavum TaxID=2173173 RepID=A0A2V1HSY0_9MICO|nr:alpha-xylosidase [Amnibacterium flavum]PVZ95716.1 alpha-xylosidase [Amnibacterium flavum]
MKFTDGFWQLRPGVDALYAREIYDVDVAGREIVLTAPTVPITSRGATLNRPTFTVTLWSPSVGVIGVRAEHFQGRPRPMGFDLVGAAPDGVGTVETLEDGTTRLVSGDLVATVREKGPWGIEFTSNGRVLTASGLKSLGYMTLAPDAQVDGGPVGNARAATSAPSSRTYIHEQLDLSVGETIYGLGERFGPVVKNGQTVDIWNADGGTSSEQAYKNVPFHLSSRGYGVLVNDAGAVSYEVGSEAVERVQFSVPGESIEYFIVDGPTPKDVLTRYTELTGRPAEVPAWSFGLWLTTSFTTDYDEATVNEFIDGMMERDLPLGVFHFDCFWMREFNWCDFEWDPRVFPDPDGMLARLHERDLRVCVWINPYIAQRSPLFREGADAGYLVKRPDGSVWQWDLWQAGMALVDFTNPEATAWYQGKLRALLDQGVDCFKTDFGERIPLEVDYFDGSAPDRMHNMYTQLYNKAVFDVLEEQRGKGDAVLFARSATAGGQQLPVHWGGDSTSTYSSMAETLRGGLSLSLSGFGFWSHDIGGFEGTPDAGVFKRWVAFGLLGSHSRLHGSNSYRVPWVFDDGSEAEGQSAVEVTRKFLKLKLQLMPYLYAAGREASATGIPVMRPMLLEFPEDQTARQLDRQYMLGADVLVAPVFDAAGEVEFYLPAGIWTNHWTGERVEGGRWLRETHGFDSLPLYIRGGAVLPWGARTDKADYDYLDGLVLELHPDGRDGSRTLEVTTPDGRVATFEVETSASGAVVSSDSPAAFSVRLPGGDPVAASSGKAGLEW